MKAATRIYSSITHNEELSCSYQSSIDIDPLHTPREEIVEVMRKALFQQREIDIQRGTTSVGPHRDDVLFEINHKPARLFASQGQQRSVVLALKMAEVEVAQDITNIQPLLLLDDVMSELDEKRRQAISSIASGGVQTIMTTTNLSYFSDELINTARVVKFYE